MMALIDALRNALLGAILNRRGRFATARLLVVALPLLPTAGCRQQAPPATAPAHADASPLAPAVVDDTDWHAVTLGAEQTLNRYEFLNEPDPQDNIPTDLWAPSVTQLHPLRVHENVVGHVEIVLKESAGEEQGL